MALGSIALWLLLVALLWLCRPRGVSIGDIVRTVPDVVRLGRALVADRSTPAGVRIALVALLVYVILPIDLIPEFIPVIGPVDDVIVALLVLRYVRSRMGVEELHRRWPGSSEGFAALAALLG